ncbi:MULTISPECIES: WS/DGAT/MGAT family O-acyltransferase [Gordonia]|uniref:Diacylglycerol O-acyltransferase n=1 Tax=Gordonia terrae C-6 TaxID=1316928 RepID=R7YF93_9ACTN|nr:MULTISPECIES: wax ester/triacylglycerol synthase family O-acyltransferase [Gordonia]EON34695.1 wax synthase-like diacyltransferase [Gordonia terrae C-6]
MQRLSGLDASFLYLETRAQLMHVIGLFEIDPSTMPDEYRFDKLRAEMERRVAAIPTFRRKLDNSLLNIDHPVWIEDEDFDIERHVHRVGVPAPGGAAEVAELCGHLAGQTLDRGKPLWELWVIEGLANGRVCAMLRMHHAGTDGVTGADMLAQMCTLTPEPPELDADKVGESAGPSSRAAMAAGGAVNFFVQRPLAMVKLLPRTVGVPIGWLRRAQQDSAMPAPFRAPRTRFNAPITPHRSIAVTQLSLDDVKRVKDHFDVKLNDVVLAMVGGALRTYLLGHDELPDRPLVGMVPVSVHGADEKDLVVSGTNKVTGMFTLLSSDESDPVARLRKQAELSRTSKAHHAEIDANILRSWAQFAPGTTLSTVMKIYGDRNWASAHPPIFNVLVSNVAGPDFPLYFLGARVTGVYPLGPIMHGLGLNITVFSADGNLNIGIVGCTDQTPDPSAIADAFDDELKQLLAACD